MVGTHFVLNGRDGEKREKKFPKVAALTDFLRYRAGGPTLLCLSIRNQDPNQMGLMRRQDPHSLSILRSIEVKNKKELGAPMT
jgi:hypothetical protein